MSEVDNINVRRLLITIEKALFQAAEQNVFDINPKTFQKIQEDTLVSLEYFKDQKIIENYENIHQDDDGNLTCDIYIKPDVVMKYKLEGPDGRQENDSDNGNDHGDPFQEWPTV